MHSFISKSTGFLTKIYKITQGLILEPTLMCLTSPMRTTSWSWTEATEMQDLLEAVNPHVAAVGMRIYASKTKVMSALISGEQRHAVLLDSEPLEDVKKFKYLGSMFVANGHQKQD